MKATELIKLLKAKIKEHGDLEVVTVNGEYCCHESVEGVRKANEGEPWKEFSAKHEGKAVIEID